MWVGREARILCRVLTDLLTWQRSYKLLAKAYLVLTQLLVTLEGSPVTDKLQQADHIRAANTVKLCKCAHMGVLIFVSSESRVRVYTVSGLL